MDALAYVAALMVPDPEAGGGITRRSGPCEQGFVLAALPEAVTRRSRTDARPAPEDQPVRRSVCFRLAQA